MLSEECQCKHPEDEQLCSAEGGVWPWSSPVPREVHEEFAKGFLGVESAPVLGLRGCSWWSLETDLSLKPLCPVMAPVTGLFAAWEHKMLSWCLPGTIHTSFGFHTGKLFLPSTPSAKQ